MIYDKKKVFWADFGLGFFVPTLFKWVNSCTYVVISIYRPAIFMEATQFLPHPCLFVLLAFSIPIYCES